MRIEHDCLICSEIGGVDLRVVWTVVQEIDDAVDVHVVFADVSSAVAVVIKLLRVVGQPTIVSGIKSNMFMILLILTCTLNLFVPQRI